MVMVMMMMIGDWASSLSLRKEALELARSVREDSILREAVMTCGRTFEKNGDVSTAIRLYTEYLDISMKMNDNKTICKAYSLLALGKHLLYYIINYSSSSCGRIRRLSQVSRHLPEHVHESG